jgi:hypothetical protein
MIHAAICFIVYSAPNDLGTRWKPLYDFSLTGAGQEIPGGMIYPQRRFLVFGVCYFGPTPLSPSKLTEERVFVSKGGPWVWMILL